MLGDGSQNVLCALIFLRGKDIIDQAVVPELAILIGKARVAPMKTLTVLELEFHAAFLAKFVVSRILYFTTWALNWRDVQFNVALWHLFVKYKFSVFFENSSCPV